MAARILISWSGERSEKIAEILREWLPTILPGVEPWLSSEDIRKGSRWSLQLATELEATQFGLLVVVPENQCSPWLNFEAGAISKWVKHARVAPLLFGMSPSELRGPLAQFQATEFTKKDVIRLLRSIAAATGGTAGAVETALDFSWSALQGRVQTVLNIISPGPSGAPIGISSQDHADIIVTDEQAAVLEKIGNSEGNFMTESNVAEALRTKRARAQMLLEELANAGYVSAEHVAMLGECYSLTGKGTKYLVDRGLI